MIFVTYASNISKITTYTDDNIKHRKVKQEDLLSLISGLRSESPSTKFGQFFNKIFECYLVSYLRNSLKIICLTELS